MLRVDWRGAGLDGVTLILGGARSGKSSFAERLAARMGSNILYIATARVEDEEMRFRVALHRARRPSGWETVEEPLSVALVVEEMGRGRDAVILDCLSGLVSNLIPRRVTAEAALAKPAAAEPAPEDPWPPGEAVAGPGWNGWEELACGAAEAVVAAGRRAGVPMVVVSLEAGMGVVPVHPLGRAFRDALGRANQVVAEAADTVYLMVAGIPWKIKG